MKTVVLKFVVCGGQVVLSPPLLRATAVSLNSLIIHMAFMALYNICIYEDRGTSHPIFDPVSVQYKKLGHEKMSKNLFIFKHTPKCSSRQ